MTKKQIQQKIARLEFFNDQMSAELEHVNEILKMAGFPGGLISLKEIALSMIEEGI